MDALRKAGLIIEGAWVKNHVALAPEPQGNRFGIFGRTDYPSQRVISFVAVGDSLVAGCGVEHQSLGLVPRIAKKMSDRLSSPVSWNAYGRLGATMRRVRYRLLPQIIDPVDILFLCAGSNDTLAGRSNQEWLDDVTAVLDYAQEKAARIIMMSAGQTYNSPVLPRLFKSELAKRTAIQTELSARICKERGVDYMDATKMPLIEDFWAEDGFHPSAAGYEQAANDIVQGKLLKTSEIRKW